MNATIGHISYYLPKKLITNNDLNEEFPHWKMYELEKKTGVFKRYIAAENETALDLSVAACKIFFEETQINPKDIGAILYCTQSPDYIMPPNALLLHRHFDFCQNIPAFDINLACSGYIYGVSIAKSMVVSGMAKNVLLVTSDTYSKYINNKDRSTRSLFGDGAAVTLIEPCEDNIGIIDQSLASDGKFYKKFYIPAGGNRQPKNDFTCIEKEDSSGNIRTDEQILMDGLGIWNYIRSKIPPHLNSFLSKNNTTIEDIDLIVFHQASKLTLDALNKVMNFPFEKIFFNLGDVGNTVSSSIPIAIADARKQGKISNSKLVLLSGFGVGLSYGSILIKF